MKYLRNTSPWPCQIWINNWKSSSAASLLAQVTSTMKCWLILDPSSALKKEKPSEDLSSYRPISLASVMGKLVILVAKKVRHHKSLSSRLQGRPEKERSIQLLSSSIYSRHTTGYVEDEIIRCQWKYLQLDEIFTCRQNDPNSSQHLMRWEAALMEGFEIFRRLDPNHAK